MSMVSAIPIKNMKYSQLNKDYHNKQKHRIASDIMLIDTKNEKWPSNKNILNPPLPNKKSYSDNIGNKEVQSVSNNEE